MAAAPTPPVAASNAGRTPALGPRELAQLATMALRARVIVQGAFAGMHHNLHAGTSMEFSEHKEYAPGDEIRRIDWKAAGRADRYYIKRFEDETEMRTFLLLDTSASMGYGRKGPSKLAYSSYLAGALAYLLAQQGDPAGLLLFSENTRNYLPPSTRSGHIREVLRLLENVVPEGQTDPARAVSHMGELADKRSLVIVFSDLLDAEGGPRVMAGQTPPTAEGPLAERLRQLRARGHDVVLFHILDPDEVELPFEDLSLFEGIEPGDTRTLLAEGADLKDAFRRESLALRERWRLACLESRVEYRFAKSDTPPAEILRAFVAARANGRH